MKILQITDIHLVPPGQHLKGFDPQARFAACIADINARNADAELCILTGDLADRGEVAAYELLRDGLAELAVPYRLMVGNHDDRGNLQAVCGPLADDDHGFLQSVVETPAGRLLLLDTVAPGGSPGGYCAARAAWLARRLEEAGDRPVFLFMHHPPFDIGIPALDAIRLRDTTGFEAAIAGRDNIRHIFFGHVHRPVSGAWRGIPYSACLGLAHQVALDFETVGRVPYSDHPPCYAVILLEEAQTTVHLHAYLDDRPLAV